jgi:TonB family protein
MLESKTFLSRASRRFLSSTDSPAEPQQRRLMALALGLLVVALVAVLYHDRDFWFPDGAEAENQLQEGLPVGSVPAVASAKPAIPIHKNSRASKPKLNASAQQASAPPAFTTVTSRTVLPPLEVEVVAGDSHQTVRPPSNEVKVELESRSAQEASEPFAAPETTAAVTTNAAEHVQMSEDTTEAVSRSVEPGYPLLARQMKVEGSVVLLAMIGRDGMVQDLRVLSGPPILATAAREAVRQWHFKPHFEGSDAVETLAKVTVNFTISTN